MIIKRLLRQEDSTLNRQFKNFTRFYGFKPILCQPYRGQTKGKVKRTMQFVQDNFMVEIKYTSLADLNVQALTWYSKVNGRVHVTTNEIPFERLKKEGLNPHFNLRRVKRLPHLVRRELILHADGIYRQRCGSRQFAQPGARKNKENGGQAV